MSADTEITVEVVMAWPRRFEAVTLALPAGSTITDAVMAASLPGTESATGYAVHGVARQASTRLYDGDRVELLRPLEMDPKQARRRRAAAKPGG